MTLPLLLSIADELDSLSTRSYADDFGFGMYPHRHYHAYGPRNEGWLQRFHKTDTDRHIAKFVQEGLEVSMDVQQFKPEELTVKTAGEFVIIEGKHDEREDEHGYITRHFIRRYDLPKGYDPADVACTLSSDGILTIKVPAPIDEVESPEEQIIEIQQTGSPHSNAKDCENAEDERDDAKE